MGTTSDILERAAQLLSNAGYNESFGDGGTGGDAIGETGNPRFTLDIQGENTEQQRDRVATMLAYELTVTMARSVGSGMESLSFSRAKLSSDMDLVITAMLDETLWTDVGVFSVKHKTEELTSQRRSSAVQAEIVFELHALKRVSKYIYGNTAIKADDTVGD